MDSFFHDDWIGSTRYLTDGTGMTTTASYRFDGYGVQSSGTAPGGTLLRFAGGHGYEDDGPAGSQLLGARYYDPTLGRFLSPDPIGHAGGLNLYGYCGNDPVNTVDPSGLIEEPRGAAKGIIDGFGYAGIVVGGFFGGSAGGGGGLLTGPGAVVATPTGLVGGAIGGAGVGWVGGRAVGYGLVWLGEGIGWLCGKAGQTISAMTSKGSGGGVGNAGSGRAPDGCGFSPGERAIADYLSGLGRNVKGNPVQGVRGKGRQGDAFVDGLLHEFKSLGEGASSGTIKNAVSSSIKRGGQARNMVFDARGSGLTAAEARRGLGRAMGISRGRIDRISIIGDDFFLGAGP